MTEPIHARPVYCEQKRCAGKQVPAQRYIGQKAACERCIEAREDKRGERCGEGRVPEREPRGDESWVSRFNEEESCD